MRQRANPGSVRKRRGGGEKILILAIMLVAWVISFLAFTVSFYYCSAHTFGETFKCSVVGGGLGSSPTGE